MKTLKERLNERCDDILRYGTIKGDIEFVRNGDYVRKYTIKCAGLIYELTKINGDWIHLSSREVE